MFTTRDISKLSQISVTERLVKLRITRDIYAKYHYKAITCTKDDQFLLPTEI